MSGSVLIETCMFFCLLDLVVRSSAPIFCNNDSVVLQVKDTYYPFLQKLNMPGPGQILVKTVKSQQLSSKNRKYNY